MFTQKDCQITDSWKYEGMQTVILENEYLRIVVLTDKGSDIVEFKYKPMDVDFLLRRSGRLRSPMEGAGGLSDLAVLDIYNGGWNEIMPNGGAPSNYKGAHFGQHGEVSAIPWKYSILDDTPDRVSVKMWVHAHRTPFYLERTMSLEKGKAVLTLEERLTNNAGEEMHCMWGHHIAFGNPFLMDGAKIFAPAKKFYVADDMENYLPRRFQPGAVFDWPNVLSPDGTPDDASIVPAYGTAFVQELGFMGELSDGWYAIVNQNQKVGFGTRFDQNLYKYLWYWQQLGDVARGYPWFGKMHTSALEVWTSRATAGISEAVDNGTALLLQPGETVRTVLKAVAFEGLTEVDSVSSSGDVFGR